MQRALIMALAAASTIAVASPAFADVSKVAASSIQGTLVHGTNTDQHATVVTGNLGTNGPNIVNFSGDTTETGACADCLELQKGTGQADVTGTIISGNTGYGINSGNIYLTGLNMQSIEFALTASADGGATGVWFSILTAEPVGPNQTLTFGSALDPYALNGETFFAFLATGGESIINVTYTAVGGTLNRVAQVRIDKAGELNSGVPEPATWAMMLLGFGGIGVAMRRRRKQTLAQVA